MTPRREYIIENVGVNMEQEVAQAPQEYPQVLADALVEQVINGEFPAAFQVLGQSMTLKTVGRLWSHELECGYGGK